MKPKTKYRCPNDGHVMYPSDVWKSYWCCPECNTWWNQRHAVVDPLRDLLDDLSDSEFRTLLQEP